MAKTVTTKLDTTRLNMALAELARLTGKDFETVVRSETAAMLGKAVEKTMKADEALINQTRDPQLRAQRLAAVGLQKKVWVQIGEKLGLDVPNVPQYVQAATAPGGDHPEDAEGRAVAGGSKFHVEGTAHRYYAPGVFTALAQAVNGRTNYFRMNLRKGVFDKAEDIARKYPGMHVNRD